MGSEIPLNSNFLGLSCQLGGLTLNGNVANGTAQTYTVVTINDPLVIQTIPTIGRTPVITPSFLQIQIGPGTPGPSNPNTYYLPLYQ
jgi:hypothetical protein